METHLKKNEIKKNFWCLFLISEDMLHFLTFPPRLAFGGFPAFTTLVGPGGSVESQKKIKYYYIKLKLLYYYRLGLNAT